MMGFYLLIQIFFLFIMFRRVIDNICDEKYFHILLFRSGSGIADCFDSSAIIVLHFPFTFFVPLSKYPISLILSLRFLADA